jgi:hypothetical protein
MPNSSSNSSSVAVAVAAHTAQTAMYLAGGPVWEKADVISCSSGAVALSAEKRSARYILSSSLQRGLLHLYSPMHTGQ